MGHLLPAPVLLWLAALLAAPLMLTGVYAFAHAVFGGVELGFTTTNFREALSGFYLTIFLRTIEFAALGTGMCLLVALPLAYFLARKVGRARGPLLILVLIPFWTSFLVRTFAWRTLLASGGPLQHLLNGLHLHHGRLDILDTQVAVMIGLVYAYLPLMALPLFVAFERIPAEVIEASKDVGAGRGRTFLGVTMPLARPGVVTAILLTFVPMTGEYVIPALLGGDKGVLMGGLIANQYLVSQDYPLGSAMAVLVLAVLTVAVFVLTRLSKGFAEVPQ